MSTEGVHNGYEVGRWLDLSALGKRSYALVRFLLRYCLYSRRACVGCSSEFQAVVISRSKPKISSILMTTVKLHFSLCFNSEVTHDALPLEQNVV